MTSGSWRQLATLNVGRGMHACAPYNGSIMIFSMMMYSMMMYSLMMYSIMMYSMMMYSMMMYSMMMYSMMMMVINFLCHRGNSRSDYRAGGRTTMILMMLVESAMMTILQSPM